MFVELSGEPVKNNIESFIITSVQEYRRRGIVPKLALIRAGDDSGQIYYENAILKQSKAYGISTQSVNFSSHISAALVEAALAAMNEDESVHGIILLRPFPEHLDEEKLRKLLNPAKDVDAVTDISIAEMITGRDDAFCACTAEACMELLRHYGISPEGRRVTVVGRSLTVGKPLSMMLLNENATVTVCHSLTPEEDQISACRNADIVILATGRIEAYGSEYFRDGQIILDVGTGIGRDGRMHGDLDITEITECDRIKDLTYSPVPGGIGRVTTALLLRNIIKAAGRVNNRSQE